MTTEIKHQIIATIDDLNQYLLGHVTDEGLTDTLKELLKLVDKLPNNHEVETN